MVQHKSLPPNSRVHVGRDRLRTIFASFFLIAIISFFALTQQPPANPHTSPQPGIIPWLFTPIEQNAFRRTPTSNISFASIFFISAQTGWAVGGRGSIIATTDGGKNWHKQNSNTNDPLQAIFFTNAQTGWAVGAKGSIVATTDGGRSWHIQVSGTNDTLRSVFFTNAQTGWAVSDSGSIVTTSDGGKSWYTQNKGTSNNLTSVFFTDVQTGWAVSELGKIVATTNGGQKWDQQNSSTSDPLQAIFFTNAQTGWAVGAKGSIVATTDGGGTWHTQNNRANDTLRSVFFINAQTGWAVSDSGSIVATSDGGGSWHKQTNGTNDTLRSVFFTDAQTGWAVGGNGSIIATTDGSKNWRSQNSGVNDTLQSVFFANAQTGWAVGESGRIVATTDGGRSWHQQNSTANDTLQAVFFANAQTGWAVGDNGSIVATADGGESWHRQDSKTNDTLRSVFFTNAQTGWTVGGNGSIVTTIDGGRKWNKQTSRTSNYLTSIFFTNAQRGWAVGERGSIIATIDGGEHWDQQTSKTSNVLQSVFFANAQTGWAVGEQGSIVATTDGGKSWHSQNSRMNSYLWSIFFTNTQMGWAVGLHGVIATTDGGRNWQSTAPYRIWPAPWYYLSLAILTPLIFFLVRKPAQHQRAYDVADVLFSDRPLEAGDADPLEYGEVSQGLSRFLRNTRTQPPLTIAITGEWGSGKTSLMNLLRAELVSYGFCPVWFNAWHHQQEEHLLAALLENVRAQAAPSWWRLEGIVFRLRLLRIRGATYWPMLLLLLTALCFSTGYFYTHQNQIETATSILKSLTEAGTKPDAKEPEKEGQETANNKKKVNEEAKSKKPDESEGSGLFASLARAASRLPTSGLSASNTSFLIWITSFLGLLVTVSKAVKAFGVKPASLLVEMGGARIRDLEQKTNFRHRFAGEFHEVTQALNPRSLTIIIDDLDRCRPENVLAVLEAVNFLVSSGECYVVMGMDMERVERCVALSFKDVADEISPVATAVPAAPASPTFLHRLAALFRPKALKSDTQGAGDTDKPSARMLFAQNYLEKLINIEVPVPTPDSVRSSALLTPEAVPVLKQTWRQKIVPALRSGALYAGIVVLLGGAVWLGSTRYPASPPRPSNPPVQSPAQKPEKSSKTAGAKPQNQKPGKSSKENVVQNPSPSVSPSPAPVLIAGASERPDATPTMLAVVIFLIAAIVGLVRTALTDVVVQDSKEFEKALLLWHPMLFEKLRTPRAMKRFMNRVRYYAMRQRSPEPRRSLWDRLWALRKPKAPETPTPDDAIPERVLVGLAVIQQCYPGFCQNPVDKITKEYLQAQPNSEALTKVMNNVDYWTDLDTYRERFRQLSAGIRVHL